MMRWSPFAFLFLIALVGCQSPVVPQVEACAQKKWNRLPEGDQTSYKALWDECVRQLERGVD